MFSASLQHEDGKCFVRVAQHARIRRSPKPVILYERESESLCLYLETQGTNQWFVSREERGEHQSIQATHRPPTREN